MGSKGINNKSPKTPAARRRGGLSGSAAHVLWARVFGRGGPALFLWLACPMRGCVPRGRWEAVPGGRPPTVVRGVWCQGCPSPGRPSLEAGSRDPLPCVPGTAGVGMGDPVLATQHALLRAGVAHCWGGRRASPGGCPATLWGASEVRRSSSPGCPPSGRAVGVRCPRAMAAGVRAWGPSTVPLACIPCGGLRAAGVVGRRPGGVAVHRCQELVSGAVPPPAPRHLELATGVPLRVFPGRGWCGRGNPAAALQRALLRAGIARCECGGTASSWGGSPRRCEGAPGIRLSPPSGCPSVRMAARARRSLAAGAAVWAWVYPPSVGPGARRGCVWCVWFLCGVCVLVGAWWCGVCRGALVRGAASLRLSPWCPPLLRYLLPLCVPLLVAVHPSLRAPLARVRLLPCWRDTLLLFFLLRRSLLIPLLFIGRPSSLACIFPCPLLRPCVRNGFFLCLLPRSLGPLCRVWPRLFTSFKPSWSCQTKKGWGFGLL